MALDSTLAPPSTAAAAKVVHQPGSALMPRWRVGELNDAPRFSWKDWASMLGPGLVAGGAAIGGGEWLLGPEVTARYGGAIMWLATLSILGQVLYNIEISRYTLYCGEPIFSGKFRTLPGPRFWLLTYLLLDLGSIFPYLAASAATPLVTMWLGHVPDPSNVPGDLWLMRGAAWGVFLLSLVPLLIGGKIYNSLRVLMTFKIFALLIFLGVLGVFYSAPSTWWNVFSGFAKFGSVPVVSGTDLDGNGKLDPSEQRVDAVDNLFVAWWQGRPFPTVDLSLIATLAAFAAIAGQGGLTNTPISNYTRDQGWGMGNHVGAIPSAFGGHHVELSHEGCVFPITPTALERWRRWVRHVVRDQLVLWMPACFFGLALPSMLSVEFLPRGTTANKWTAAAMTAGGVRDRVASLHGADWGEMFWYATLFCGFLALGPTMATTADGIVRRWVDALWISSPTLRRLDTRAIRKVYFGVLVVWAIFGLTVLSISLAPGRMVNIAMQFYNLALGVSCWHTVVINCTLLPRELRPGWLTRILLVAAGVYFTGLSAITALHELGYL